jgi:hypothetical protein
MSEALIAVIRLILTYGIPGAIQIIQTFSKTEITQADIDALLDIKPPESFFTTTTVTTTPATSVNPFAVPSV